MANNISLTVRLPHELNVQLAAIAKEVGMTKTNLIRSAIHGFLTEDENNIDFSQNNVSQRDRLVLNVNQITYSILENASKKHNESINSVITAVSILALERSSKWLQSTKQ